MIDIFSNIIFNFNDRKRVVVSLKDAPRTPEKKTFYLPSSNRNIVHNVCVRYICNIRRSDHITPSLERLSWLRLRERRTFHSLSLLFKILDTSTPSYLSNRFNRLSHFHNLGTRSQQCSILSIPSNNTSLYSSLFTVSLAKTLNSLPLSIRDCRTLSKLKNKQNFCL